MGGGRPARQAVRRWSLRLLRREWRQQLLVLGLLTSAIAVAVFAATAAYNVAPSRDAEFGTADTRIEYGISDPGAVEGFLVDAEDWFGTIEVIERRAVPVPGSTTTVELRAQAADGVYSRPMLATVAGRHPSTPAETALTDGVASLLGVDVGDEVTLGGDVFDVVGLVENPEDLDDEFALLPAGALTAPEQISVLVRAGDERGRTFRPAQEPGMGFIESRGQTEDTTAAIGVFAVASVGMILISLVAGAAFVTLAHRRRRQLGMLAALGATPRHLRRAMVANGLAVGVVAGAMGTVAAVAAWLAVGPSLESAAGHRIARFDIPLWLPVTGVLLAIGAAVVAAWWPARAVSRIPVTESIAGRPSAPRPVRRPLVLAAVLLAGGVTGIALGVDPNSDEVVPQLFLPGLVATVAATVFFAAPALRGVATVSGRLPVASRIAIRDLARFQSRSAAALGAISLGLAIAVTVVVVAAAAAPAADHGNLSDRQLIVWTAPGGDFDLQVPELSATDVERFEAAIDQIAHTVDDPTVVPLDVAVDPRSPELRGGQTLLGIAALGRRVGERTLRDVGRFFVATPTLVRHLGLQPEATDDMVLLTPQEDEAYVTGNISGSTFRRNPVPEEQVRRIRVPDHRSAPRNLITTLGMDAAGLVPMRAGWLLEAAAPFAADDLDAAREIAADAGLAIEVRDDRADLTTVRTVASAVGVLVALCILALTIGLLRSDAVHEVRTLTATGATSRTRRALTASTAATLAVVGVLIGTATAYAALVAGYWPETDRLSDVPATHLVSIAIGLPVLAAAVSWLAAGRDPTTLAPRVE